MLKSFLIKQFNTAMADNKKNILKYAGQGLSATFLDLGCDDGTWTKELVKASRAGSAHGVEIVPHRAKLADDKGIKVTIADLASPLPLKDNVYDLIHSNQVIEHVPDVDRFASEIFRMLKPGGRVIVSTENGSSWHNIFAALLGWQIFSLTNMSHLKAGIGNPLALHRNESIELKTWTHKVIFNYRGLIEFFMAHGFENVSVSGAGYYPLPSAFGTWDPRHAHFLTLSATKKLS